jgi:hypothetical protein
MMMNNWTWMPGFGIAHWVIFIAVVVLILYPIGRILRRLGLSPFWSLLVFIPLVNLISLWILAFSEWPAGKNR